MCSIGCCRMSTYLSCTEVKRLHVSDQGNRICCYSFVHSFERLTHNKMCPCPSFCFSVFVFFFDSLGFGVTFKLSFPNL